MSGSGESIANLRDRLTSGRNIDPAELQRLAADPRAGVRALARRLQRRIEAAATEAARLQKLLVHERALWDRGVLRVAGVDEAGAGPLAGPVVAAAVILAPGTMIDSVDDSKKLTAKKREELAAEIEARAVAWAVGVCEPEEIDRLNIFQAGRQAMRRAVDALRPAPEHLLVDARIVPGWRASLQTPLIDGDARCQSIAAASIIAKVTRDAIMDELHERWPDYGFADNRGYGTPAHLAALQRLGPTAAHRRSFAPVTQLRLL
jgi:ribonuclease HII